MAIHGIDRLAGAEGEFDVRICATCGTGMTFPLVDDAGLAAFYNADYNPHADWEPPAGLVAKVSHRIRAFIVDRALKTPPLSALAGRTGSTLDVGCGRGDLGALLISQGWTAAGVDPSPEACAIANKQGVEATAGTLASVDFAGRTFDAITFQHSLEHVVDPAGDLELVADLLNPGGLLLVSVPNFGSRQRKIFNGRWFHLDLPRHRYHYTAAGLESLAKRSGLEVQTIATTSTPVGLPGSIMYALFGHWLFSGPISTRVFTLGSLAIYPAALLMNKFGGGDALHLVAVKPG